MARKDARTQEPPIPRERPVTFKGLGANFGKITEIADHPINPDFLNVTVEKQSLHGNRTVILRYEAVPRDALMVTDGDEQRAAEVGDDLEGVPPHNCRTYDLGWSPFDGAKDDEP